MIENLEILFSLWISSSLYLLFVSYFFALPSFFFHLNIGLKLILFLLLESIGPLSCKPPSGQSLDE